MYQSWTRKNALKHMIYASQADISIFPLAGRHQICRLFHDDHNTSCRRSGGRAAAVVVAARRVDKVVDLLEQFAVAHGRVLRRAAATAVRRTSCTTETVLHDNRVEFAALRRRAQQAGRFFERAAAKWRRRTGPDRGRWRQTTVGQAGQAEQTTSATVLLVMRVVVGHLGVVGRRLT